jgi:hypothetical protein
MEMVVEVFMDWPFLDQQGLYEEVHGGRRVTAS